MSFGLINVLAVFMDLMNWAFQSYLDQFVIAFVDDIFICSRSREEQDTYLRIAL